MDDCDPVDDLLRLADPDESAETEQGLDVFAEIEVAIAAISRDLTGTWGPGRLVERSACSLPRASEPSFEICGDI